MINRESVNKCCWNVVFSNLGHAGIPEGHLAFVVAKNIDTSCHEVHVQLGNSAQTENVPMHQ